MDIIDSQVHVWPKETSERPISPEVAERLRSHMARGLLRMEPSHGFGADELIPRMEAVGVTAAILVPQAAGSDRNDTALEAAAAHPGSFAVMGLIALEHPAEAAEVIKSWRTHPGALGFRVSFSSNRASSASQLTDGTADWFWEEAEKGDFPVMVNVHGKLAELAAVAEKHPGLRIALDHFGLASNDKDAKAIEVVDALCGLARLPNVSVKVSSAPSYTTESYPFPIMQGCIERVASAFGAQRVFWGSDLTRLPCTYRDVLDLVTRECNFLTGAEKELVLGKALEEWLRWER